MKVKNKIDLMEELDDLEKYQGKWKALLKYKNCIRASNKTSNSEIEADNYAKKYISDLKNKYGDKIFELIEESGKTITILTVKEIIYLGAIPVKE